MKYIPFSIWLVRNPQKLKEFNEVYRMVCENEDFRNYVRTSIEQKASLKRYDFAALECYEKIDGAEKRHEENKKTFENKEREKERAKQNGDA